MPIPTATNPETNEKIAFFRGEWLPVARTATNPTTGARAYLINDQWIIDEVPAPPAPIERTFSGQVGELFRGIPRGAVNLLESAGIGASALLPEGAEESVRGVVERLGESAAAPFQRKPGYEDSMAGTFGEVAGSFLPLMATGALGLAGRAAATGLAGAAGAGTARTRAEQGGATPEERAKATALGTAVGLSEVLVPFRILDNALDATAATTIFNRIKRAGITGGAEGAQEAAAEVAQNLIEKGLYDPEQGVFVGTGESFGYGAGVGGLVQGLMDLFVKDRGGAPAPQPIPEEDTQPPEPTEATIEETPTQPAPEWAPVVAAEVQNDIAAKIDNVAALRKAGELYADYGPEAAAAYSRAMQDAGGITKAPATTPAVVQEGDEEDITLTKEELDAAGVSADAPIRKQVKFRARTPAPVEEAVTPVQEAVSPTVTWETMQPGQMVTLYRGESSKNDANGQFWTTNKAKAEKYGTVTEVRLPAETISKHAAVGANGVDEFVFTNLRPKDLTTAVVEPVEEAAAQVYQPVRFNGDRGVAGNESVSASLRVIREDDDIALDEPERVGAVLLQNIDRVAGGKPGRATDVLRQITDWADSNNKPLVLMPSGDIAGSRNELIKWYGRNGFVVEPDGAMVRQPKVEDTPVVEQPVTAPEQEAPAADQGAAPQQMAFDFDAALDEAGVPKAAPVRKRVKNKSPAQAKAELTAFAANPVVKPEVAAAVTKLADSIPVEAAPAAQVPEVPVETAPAAVEEAAEPATTTYPDQDIRSAAEELQLDDMPAKGKATQWLGNLRTSDPETYNRVVAQIEGVDLIPTQKTSLNQDQGESSYSTDLYPYITDFDSAVAAIVNYASNPAQKEIAQKIAARLKQLKAAGFEFSLEITPEGYRLRGARGQSVIDFSGLGEATTVKVTLNHPSNGDQSGTGWVVVAHELAHAATQAQIKYAPKGTAAAKLNRLYDDVVAHFNRRVKEGNLTEFEKSIYNRGNNALQSADELLAWGLTSEPMQRWLDSIKSKNGSFLSRLFDVVASALGISNNDTALSELLSIADGMLTETIDTYTEVANKQGQSFGKQENTTGYPSWALGLALGKPIVWAEKDAALVQAQSITGNKIYLLATPIGISRVDVGSYSGGMLSSVRLKEVQAVAAGMQKTSPNVDRTISAAERALTDQTPAANVRFLNVQGAQLKKASTPVKAPRFKRAVAALFDKGQEAVTKTMIWGLGIDQINDYVQSYIKKKGPNYEPFAASFNRFTQITGKLEGEMRQFIDGITAQVARMGDWRNSHPDLYEDMNALVYGGTLDKVDLTKPKSTYVGNPDKLKAYDRLKKIYDKLEPSGGAAVYRQMRAIYNRVFNNISQQVYDRVYSETQDANLATTIKNKFTEQMKLSGLEGYAALTRNNGKYRIKYFLPKSDVPYFEIFENSADWNARQKQLLEEDGVNPKDMQPFLHGDQSVFDGIVPTSFMGDLVQTLKNKGASDDVLQAVMELGISVSPAQVVMERLAKRKETPGYTVDAFAAFQESVVGLQRKLINMKYGAQMSKEVRDMRATRKNVPTDPNVDYFIGEAASRAEYAANPNQNLISNVLTTGTYGWTLGLNVSSAIVDMMSLIVTGGYLSGKFKSRRKAHAALVKAGRDILGMGTTADVETMVTQGLEGDALKEALATAGITERDVARRRVAPSMLNIDFNNPEQVKKYGYLRALVNKVQQQGHSERFSDLEERAEFGETNWISKIAARMGFMMSTSERFKRETGLKAYYDLALAEVAPNGDPTKATPEQMEKAANDAMEMSRLLNGGSTPVTGPGFQRDNFWRVAFMYRSFAFRQMYVQVKTLYDATMNDEKVVRDAARKFGSTVLLTSGALVGVQGMPLFGPVALLLNVLAQPFVDDEEEEKFVQNMLRSNLDPLIYEGLPNALLNMNVSERASLTDLLARDTNLPDDATFAETLAAHFGGPAFGSIERGLRGWRLIEQGQVQRGIESMVPTTLASILKSIRFATDGAAETLRGDDVIQISPVAVVSQFLGFTPADYARTMELKSVQAGIDRRISERKSNLYAAAYAAYRVGDSAGLAQVMQKMIEFNQKFPAEAITSEGLRQSLRTRDRNSAAMLGGTLPRESRRSEWQEAADDWGVQFPE